MFWYVAAFSPPPRPSLDAESPDLTDVLVRLGAIIVAIIRNGRMPKKRAR